MKENKKENGWERNFIAIFSGELGWEIVQQFTSEKPMNCFGELIQQIRLGGLCKRFYQNSVVCFQEQKSFLKPGESLIF